MHIKVFIHIVVVVVVVVTDGKYTSYKSGSKTNVMKVAT